jgi:hypothetical protein
VNITLENAKHAHKTGFILGPPSILKESASLFNSAKQPEDHCVLASLIEMTIFHFIKKTYVK